uniref:Uncharacterized protein n=1 Tax=Trichuris muris TaxID=70415 RepID=A0A5S6R0S3_TRIMR
MRIQHHRRSNPVLPRKVERFLPNFKPSISAAAVAAITARFAYLQRHSAFLPCWRVVGASSARAPLVNALWSEAALALSGRFDVWVTRTYGLVEEGKSDHIRWRVHTGDDNRWRRLVKKMRPNSSALHFVALPISIGRPSLFRPIEIDSQAAAAPPLQRCLNEPQVIYQLENCATRLPKLLGSPNDDDSPRSSGRHCADNIIHFPRHVISSAALPIRAVEHVDQIDIVEFRASPLNEEEQG